MADSCHDEHLNNLMDQVELMVNAMHGWDHLDISGIGIRPQFQVNRLYLDIANRLQSLPQ